jgi:hypothetical protein
LVHGFNKDESDMFPLKRHLNGFGYRAVTVNLPLTFCSLNDCISSFEDQLKQLVNNYEKIHFIGHSMGGLVIRSFLARHKVAKLGRCVLISTPNKGTKLADIIEEHCKPLGQIYKPLQSLKTCSINIGKPENIPKPEIGVIAGKTKYYLMGLLLSGENDGRVEVDSAKCEDMADFIIRPYGHKEIHHQTEIAELSDVFLCTGKFTPAEN